MDESNVTWLKDVDETAHAYAYRDELVDCERSFNTIKKYVSVFKTFMAYSVHKGWMPCTRAVGSRSSLASVPFHQSGDREVRSGAVTASLVVRRSNRRGGITIYLEDVEVRQCKSKDTVKTYRTTLRRFEKMMDESNVTWLKD
ncbi:hypothetical protein, partial [Acinetobacter soli]